MSTTITNRLNAFQTIGEDVSAASDPHAALDAAGLLGWNVRKLPAQAAVITDAGVSTVTVPHKFVTVRDSADGPLALGTVGASYTPYQNEEIADALTAIVDVSGGRVESAGHWNNGRSVFASMRLPEGIMVGGHDAVDMYLTAFNSHDGSSALMLAVTPFRVYCANMQQMVSKRHASKFIIRKTSNSALRIAEARAQLEMTFAYAGDFQRQAERLLSTKISDAQFDLMIEKLFPTKPDAEPTPAAVKRSDDLRWLFRTSETNANIRNTAWGAYQALGEYVDHFSAGGEDGRAMRLITQSAPEKLKNRAHTLLSAANLSLVA